MLAEQHWRSCQEMEMCRSFSEFSSCFTLSTSAIEFHQSSPAGVVYESVSQVWLGSTWWSLQGVSRLKKAKCCGLGALFKSNLMVPRECSILMSLEMA